MEQTAVEYVIQNVIKKHFGGGWLIDETIKKEIEQANEMFEKQIKNAFDHGDLVGRASVIREINPNDKVVLKYPEISAEEYYNQTFKTE